MSRQGFLLLDGWLVTTEFFIIETKNEQNRKSDVLIGVSVSQLIRATVG